MIVHNCLGHDGKRPLKIVFDDTLPDPTVHFCCYCGKQIPYPEKPVTVVPAVPQPDFITEDAAPNL